jgi:hypothetical protein
MKNAIVILMLFGATLRVAPAPGDLDPTFGIGGKVYAPICQGDPIRMARHSHCSQMESI